MVSVAESMQEQLTEQYTGKGDKSKLRRTVDVLAPITYGIMPDEVSIIRNHTEAGTVASAKSVYC